MATFRHIHCSGRYDRPAAQLEADLDDWMGRCSLITLTEMNNDARASTMAEKGWAHFNASGGAGRDDAAVLWRRDAWKAQNHWVRKLNTTALQGARHWVWACSVMLRFDETGHRLLCSAAHLPAHINPVSAKPGSGPWQVRKRIYQQAMKNWHTYLNQLAQKTTPDAVMAVGDFNLNLKADWVYDYLHDLWKGYGLGWKNMPGAGGALHGGNTMLAAGTPGKGTVDNIIDGTLYRGLDQADHPTLMNRVNSSDHRPFTEAFSFNNKPGRGIKDGSKDPITGNHEKGDAWWGFGDYLDDEIYQVDTVTAGTEES